MPCKFGVACFNAWGIKEIETKALATLTPYVFEFSGLEDKAAYHESDLENAILSKMQDFMLEMGKGFLFEKRQRRFVFNEKNYYLDLVLYNRYLQCYVLIDFIGKS